MKPTQKRAFGRSGLEVTAMGLGTAPIGNQFRFVPDSDARAVIDGAWDAGLRYFDTAPFYGNGLSELRLGEALRWRPRDAYVLSTKVGRLLKPKPRKEIESRFWIDPAPFEVIHDYSYDGAMRSFEDSLQRMALERIDVAFIHDIDNFSHPPDVQKTHFRTAMNGAYKALDKLRSEGLVKAIGVGCNEWQVCDQALRERDFDCFLLAGRYTLLEQDALELVPAALRAAKRRDRARGRVQQRHPGDGRRQGRALQLRPRPGAHPGACPVDRGFVRTVRRRVEGGGAAIRPRPSVRADGHSRHAEPRAS